MPDATTSTIPKSLSNESLDRMDGQIASFIGRGEWEQAEKILLRAIERRKAALGSGHNDTLTSTNDLAGVLAKQGRFTEAEAMHQATLDTRQLNLQKATHETIGALDNLALAMLHSQKYEDAEMLYRQALELRSKWLGDEHLDTLGSMSTLVDVFLMEGKYVEAENLMRKLERACKSSQQAMEKKDEKIKSETLHPPKKTNSA